MFKDEYFNALLPSQLSSLVVGEIYISASKLIDFINFEDFQGSEIPSKFKELLHAWEEEGFLSHFVFLVTGVKSLPVTPDKSFITVSRSNRLALHTCDRRLDLPDKPEELSKLKEKLQNAGVQYSQV